MDDLAKRSFKKETLFVIELFLDYVKDDLRYLD